MRDGNLRAIFRQKLPSWHWQSIESGGTGSGIPDSNFCTSGVEGWLEFKRTRGWVVPLSPPQVAWLARRSRAGGYCLVAVRQERRDGDVLYIYRGEQGTDLVVRGLRDVPPLGGPWVEPWPWESIGAVVLRGFTQRTVRA